MNLHISADMDVSSFMQPSNRVEGVVKINLEFLHRRFGLPRVRDPVPVDAQPQRPPSPRGGRLQGGDRGAPQGPALGRRGALLGAPQADHRRHELQPAGAQTANALSSAADDDGRSIDK